MHDTTVVLTLALTGELSGGLIFTDIPTDCDDWLDAAAMPAVTWFVTQPGTEK